ncbi:hypothetical protein NXT3_PB00151 (plasmid) [Sinorhizobium fredii]|uniref:Uncharacterized protein n=1 Tax=Rhizobium fredii TaxID=380 RepID=A0A2L0HCB7_RHIFR|nr:hypothetical protein NXT3_PB00151 [Sinorhizobium fredii]
MRTCAVGQARDVVSEQGRRDIRLQKHSPMVTGEVLLPIMRELADVTSESVAFYVR